MPTYSHSWWGALAALAGICVAALWAAGSLNWQTNLAMGIILSLTLFAVFMLLAPFP